MKLVSIRVLLPKSVCDMTGTVLPDLWLCTQRRQRVLQLSMFTQNWDSVESTALTFKMWPFDRSASSNAGS